MLWPVLLVCSKCYKWMVYLTDLHFMLCDTDHSVSRWHENVCRQCEDGVTHIRNGFTCMISWKGWHSPVVCTSVVILYDITLSWRVLKSPILPRPIPFQRNKNKKQKGVVDQPYAINEKLMGVAIYLQVQCHIYNLQLWSLQI